jgi:hypothetical protein
VVDLLSSTGAKVVLFTMPDLDVTQTAPNGQPFPENNPIRVTEWNHIVDTVAAQRKKVVTLVNLNRMADPHGQFQEVIDGVTVRWADGIHFAKTGGEWLQPDILPTIAQIGLKVRASGTAR